MKLMANFGVCAFPIAQFLLSVYFLLVRLYCIAVNDATDCLRLSFQIIMF